MKSQKRSKSKSSQNEANRSWSSAIVFAAIAVAVVLAIAVVGNLAIGRVIHWNIVSVLGVVGFVFLSIGRKYRTI